MKEICEDFLNFFKIDKIRKKRTPFQKFSHISFLN